MNRHLLKDVAGGIGENLERTEEITVNSNSIAEGELVCVQYGSEDGTTELTDNGVSELGWLLAADVSTWSYGSRQFLFDKQPDPKMIRRVIDDEFKRIS